MVSGIIIGILIGWLIWGKEKNHSIEWFFVFNL
jgi:F0F1-type ATP synthase assembly protein I